MTQESYLEQLPQPAMEVRNGVITALNAAALAQLPDLACGQAAPEFLRAPLSANEQNGCFSHQGDTFLFTRLFIATIVSILCKIVEEYIVRFCICLTISH